MDFGYNSTLFERELRSEIEKRRDQIAVQIVSSLAGSGDTDFAACRHLGGYVAAFEEVLQIADAIKVRLIKPQE